MFLLKFFIYFAYHFKKRNIIIMEDSNKNEEKKEFSKRFQEAIDALNFKSQADFARDIEISSPSLNQYLKGGIKPSGEITLRLIKKYPSLNWYYVYFGEGKLDEEMPISNKTLANKMKELEIENVKLQDLLNKANNNLEKEKSTNELLQKFANIVEKYDKRITELEGR